MNPNDAKEKLIKELYKNKTIEYFSLPLVIAFFFISVVLGFTLGFFLSKSVGPSLSSSTNSIKSTKSASGILDKEQFPDKAEGLLKKGGIDGEGNFHIERKGGESQNVYLTSSTVDLAQFVGKKVRVWGQTFTAQTAGWLMDVGYIEVL